MIGTMIRHLIHTKRIPNLCLISTLRIRTHRRRAVSRVDTRITVPRCQKWFLKFRLMAFSRPRAGNRGRLRKLQRMRRPGASRGHSGRISVELRIFALNGLEVLKHAKANIPRNQLVAASLCTPRQRSITTVSPVVPGLLRAERSTPKGSRRQSILGRPLAGDAPANPRKSEREVAEGRAQVVDHHAASPKNDFGARVQEGARSYHRVRRVTPSIA